MNSEHPATCAGARVATAKRMEDLGAALGEALLGASDDRPAFDHLGRAVVIYLQGPLGAGKTTFARGVLRAFGVAGVVKSPTYTLVEPYATVHGTVAHFDFYRLVSLEEADFLGLREYLDRGVCLFEWPERALSALPPADVRVEIALSGSARELTATAYAAPGRGLLKHLVLRELLQESVPNT